MDEVQLDALMQQFFSSGASNVRDLYEAMPWATQPQIRIYLVLRYYVGRYRLTDLGELLEGWKQAQLTNRSSLTYKKNLEALSLKEYMERQAKAMIRP